MMRSLSLADLAEHFSAKLVGDGSVVIERVADIGSADVGAITFFINEKFRSMLVSSHASAIILREEDLPTCAKPALVCNNPHALFARIAAFLHPDEDMLRPPGVSPAAWVSPSAHVHPTAVIGPYAVIEDAAEVMAHAYIGPGCVVGRRAKIGESTKLTANVTVAADCQLGMRVIVHPGAVIGSDGFGLARENGKWLKIPQLGKVYVGDDVEIGAGVAIDRGALKDTIIENGVKLDNQIHVAHNVIIGENTAIAAQSGVAGSTVIGKNCEIGGAVGIVGHLHIADRCRLNAFTTVTHSIEKPGGYASSTPVDEVSRWRKNYARFKQLDNMARRLNALEKRLKALEKP